jgi:fatty-acyl-CoA synthase
MYGTQPTDVILNGFPLFHVAGSFVYGLSTLLAGGEVVLPTRTGLRNTAFMSRFGDFVEHFGVTLLAAVPTVIASLLSLNLDGDRLRSVRALLTGGSPLPDELAATFEARHGIPVRNILGMTESAGVISIEPLASSRTPGSCGLALPYTRVIAVGADGTHLPPGSSGILRIQGPNVSPGYTDPQRNAGTFEQGWLVSGDIGHVDAEGRVFVTGRAKDVIIRGAHNIDPGMIESVLLRHPSVMMAAAVGEPDAYAGELPVAFVSLKPGEQVTPEELLAFITPLIAERPALPKRIHILSAVPMTAVGKVYKPRLRAEATRHAMAAQLTQRGLMERVEVDVEETAGGLSVRYTTADPAAEAAIRELMKPFALSFSIAQGANR